MGNPAGIVFGGENLTDKEMQDIAQKVGFNETTFIMNSEKADVRLRYFTPGHEMNLCGHGTIAAIYSIIEMGRKENISTIETKAGILNIIVKKTEKNNINILMKQTPAKFIPFDGNINKLAEVLGLKKEDLDLDIPITYGNTGIWTLLVPIKNLDSFTKMKPENSKFPEVLEQIKEASIHPFCFATYNKEADMHGRHFSSPYSGTIEDPVTGTASGVMGAYYLKYMNSSKQKKIIIEQGQEIGKNGIVIVNAKKENNEINVEIEGTAVYVKEILI